MTRYLPIGAVFLGVTLTFVACTVGKQQQQPSSIPVTCRQLRDTPASYAGYRVNVSTAGTEILDGRLVYRLHNPGGPDVEFSFSSGKIPDPLPTEVEGICLAPVRGGPVRVINCR